MNTIQQIPPTLALLSIISMVGGIGNLFVILIYIRRCDKITSNLFMTVLAGSDIFTCIFIIPTTIFIEFHEWQIGSSFVCKSYMFFNNSLIPFSALLISLIAMDRYFCICHPFLQIMNMNRSKLFICIVLMLSILLGILASFQVHIETKPTNVTGNYELINISTCVEASEWKDRSLSQQLFYQITQKSQLVSYSICILIVIGLYSAIYYTVIKVRRKKDQLKNVNKMKKIEKKKTQCKSHMKPKSQYRVENSDNSPIYSRYVVSNYPRSERNINHNENFSVPQHHQHHSNSPTNSSINSMNNSSSIVAKTLRNVRETTLLQNLKLAAMLFVVGITYIVTFLPANLMANKIINLNLPVFYLYYVNNAANPIIYCFMNRNFRNKLKSLRFFRPVIRK